MRELTAYDDWFDSLPLSKQNAILEASRYKKRPLWKKLGYALANLLKLAGWLAHWLSVGLEYLSQGLKWLGAELAERTRPME